jgi:hypothetical protein
MLYVQKVVGYIQYILTHRNHTEWKEREPEIKNLIFCVET